jgi:copper oxidase (laccase) domain-containing protein
MNDMTLIQSAPLTRFAWIEHRFGTRDDRAPADDQAEAQDTMASLTQVHSALVINVSLNVSTPGCAGEGDAPITNRRDSLPGKPRTGTKNPRRFLSAGNCKT